MSEDLHNRLQAAAEHYPTPSEQATERARARFLAAGETSRSGTPRLKLLQYRPAVRAVIVVLGVALFAGASFAAGLKLGSSEPANPSGTAAAGPGFLPAFGWNVAQSGLTAPPGGTTAVAANVPFAPADRVLIAPPSETIKSLGPSGVLLHASFVASGPGDYPGRRFPLRLADAEPGSLEGFPARGKTLRLNAHAGGYDVDVLIIFGADNPSADVRAAADQELSRLVTPSCPANADRLDAGDLDAAREFVVRWVRDNYVDQPAQLVGLDVVARPLTDAHARLRGAAVSQCGAGVERTIVEVDLELPPAARRTTGPGPFSYLVYREGNVWTIWQPA